MESKSATGNPISISKGSIILSKVKQNFWLLTISIFIGMAFSISATQLPENTTQNTKIIDVRSPKEFADNSNPASINIPLAELETKISEIDKDQTVIVCCASGRRSEIAAAILKKNGFKNVVDAGSWENTVL